MLSPLSHSTTAFRTSRWVSLSLSHPWFLFRAPFLPSLSSVLAEVLSLSPRMAASEAIGTSSPFVELALEPLFGLGQHRVLAQQLQRLLQDRDLCGCPRFRISNDLFGDEIVLLQCTFAASLPAHPIASAACWASPFRPLLMLMRTPTTTPLRSRARGRSASPGGP